MKHGWEYKKLGDVCEIYQPKTISSNMLVDNGKYPVYGANGIIGRYDQFNHPDKELLMTCRGATCGTINISLPYSWINGNAMVIHPLKNDIILDFLKYQLSALDLSVVITGAAQPQITRQSLSPLSISIPPIEEQKKICSLLDNLNLVIEKKKEQISELDNLAQSLFYDMFGDPITNGKGWGVKRMKDVAPAVEYKGEHPQIDGKFWLLNLDKVEAQTGNILSVDYYDYDEIGNSVVSFDSSNVLYSKLRPYLNKVVVPTEIGYATSELVPLQPNISLLERQYLAYMLRSKQFVEFINSKVAGAKMPRVAMNVFRDFLVPVPPLPLQQAFAEKVKAIERQKELINQSIKDVQTLFDAKMDYYFGD